MNWLTGNTLPDMTSWQSVRSQLSEATSYSVYMMTVHALKDDLGESTLSLAGIPDCVPLRRLLGGGL